MNQKRFLTFVLLVGLALLTALALNLRTPPIARAMTITVDSTADVAADEGQCTLREAIIAANTDTASGGASGECAPGSGDDTIDLTGIAGTIHLTGPLPDITSNVVINGPGVSSLIVRRGSGGDYRVFTVGITATVTISGLTVSTGRVEGDNGGGIYNAGTLTLTDSLIDGNNAYLGHGGGIYNAITGTLTLSNSIVSNNTLHNPAHGSYGGGIYNAGTLTLNDSTVFGNGTFGDHCHGGGIHNEGTLTLNGSTVDGNNASTDDDYGGDGGGIHNVGGGVMLKDSTIRSNSSNGSGNGGGLWNGDGASMKLINSTLSFNVSYGGGGGIYNTGVSTLTLNNSTIGSFNYAFDGNGGGLWNGDNSTVNLKNSVIAGNVANSSGSDCHNAATLTSLDYNLVGDDSDCAFTPQTNDQLNVNPLLGALRDNGGPTETRALLNGSPAIDAIPQDGCTDPQGAPIATDQRGVPRPQGVACDIGAYEVDESVDLSLTKRVNEASPPVGDNVVFTVQAVNNGPLAASGVVISDRLPLGLTLASFHAGQGTYTHGTGEWDVGGMTAGLSATLTLTATADAGAVGRTLTNAAVITAADQLDPDVTNNLDMATVTPTDRPIAGLVATNDGPTSLGQTTTLTATVTAGSNVTYVWAFGDGSPVVSGQWSVVSHNYPAAGVYAAVVTASNSVNALSATTTVTVSAPAPMMHRVCLPLIVRQYVPPPTFPLYIGDAIPERPVAYQGEVFYTTSLWFPSQLPPGGHFYFSSQPDAVAEVLVDDELVVLLEGTEVLSYDFSTSGLPVPDIVEVPRSTMEGLAGRKVTIVYRDIYSGVVEASAMWLIWSP